MSLPSSVKVGPHTYRITSSLDDVHTVEDAVGEMIFGSANHELLRIVVTPGLPLSQEQATLLHEILHCVTWHTRLRDRLPPTEEEVVSRVEATLLSVLQENPEVVAYLTGLKTNTESSSESNRATRRRLS